MPRQRSAGRAPARPTVAPRAPAPQAQQTRPASTLAPTQTPAQAPPQASQGPGLFGQMASTAAGVAIGSSVGHAIGGLFGGGGSSDVAAQETPQAAQQQNAAQDGNCAGALKSFTTCMDEQNGNMSICNWYLEQVKACQAAASQY